MCSCITVENGRVETDHLQARPRIYSFTCFLACSIWILDLFVDMHCISLTCPCYTVRGLFWMGSDRPQEDNSHLFIEPVFGLNSSIIEGEMQRPYIKVAMNVQHFCKVWRWSTVMQMRIISMSSPQCPSNFIREKLGHKCIGWLNRLSYCPLSCTIAFNLVLR